jgi:hypothetical protein
LCRHLKKKKKKPYRRLENIELNCQIIHLWMLEFI